MSGDSPHEPKSEAVVNRTRFVDGAYTYNWEPKGDPIPEPVVDRFKRLPLPMQMRIAASVIDSVNRRRSEIASMPPLDHSWNSSSLHRWADAFEAEDHEDIRCDGCTCPDPENCK